MSSPSLRILGRLTSVVLLATAPLLHADTAASNWAMHCQKCHAGDGSGKTAYGEKMKVRDYRSPAVQASFTDQDAIAVLRGGAKDPAGKQLMVAYKDRLNDAELAALVNFLRSLQKR